MPRTKIRLPKSHRSFPIWAQYKDSLLVVNFTSKNRGTIWSKGDAIDCRLVGHYSEDWVSCFDKTCWEILPKGTVITLTI